MHPCWEIILNIRGKGVETVGSRQHAFYPGSICVCPPNTMHEKKAESSASLWQDIYLRFFDPELLFQPRSVWTEDDNAGNVETLLRVLQTVYYSGRSAAARHLCDAICHLILSLDSSSRPGKLTQQLVDEMAQNLTNPEFSAADAVARTGYCADYVRRVFRADTGMTPTAYLTRMRVTHAKSLLHSPQKPALSVHEAALLSGFYDANNFCQVSRNTPVYPPNSFKKGRRRNPLSAPCADEKTPRPAVVRRVGASLRLLHYIMLRNSAAISSTLVSRGLPGRHASA